jgi:putative membrane protein
MIEAHEGQQAQSQAERADVKAFGKTLDQDHTRSYEVLTELASKTGISIPRGIDTAQVRELVHLSRLKGDRFDQQFASDEVAAHRHTIAVYKREAKRGHDADVKAYAAGTVPVLEKHLRDAEALVKRS